MELHAILVHSFDTEGDREYYTVALETGGREPCLIEVSEMDFKKLQTLFRGIPSSNTDTSTFIPTCEPVRPAKNRTYVLDHTNGCNKIVELESTQEDLERLYVEQEEREKSAKLHNADYPPVLYTEPPVFETFKQEVTKREAIRTNKPKKTWKEVLANGTGNSKQVQDDESVKVEEGETVQGEEASTEEEPEPWKVSEL